MDDELNPFLTQLLLDLRNAVWALEAHNRILDRNVHGWRSPDLDLQDSGDHGVGGDAGAAHVAVVNKQCDELRRSVDNLEAQRRIMVVGWVACVLIGMGLIAHLK